MAIITKTVGGYGPYAYRVTYVDPEQQTWTYLGPVGQVDPADLSDDEIEELRDEKLLSRFRETTNVAFASLVVANEIRDDLVDRCGEVVLALADDRRSTTLRIAEDAPEDCRNLADQEARDDRENARTVGQADLSDAEKKRLDFAERPIFHAQASKSRDSGRRRRRLDQHLRSTGRGSSRLSGDRPEQPRTDTGRPTRC